MSGLPDRNCLKDARFCEFVRIFNEEEFFEAHEVLEEMWLEKSGADRDFLQGLIQIAASLVHVQRDNPRGAGKVAESAMRYLEPFPDSVYGFSLGRLRGDLARCLENKSGFPRIIFFPPD